MSIIGILFGTKWDDNLGHIASGVLEHLTPFAHNWPAGRLSVCYPCSDPGTILTPHGWKPARGMWYVRERSKVKIEDVAVSGVKEFQGKGLRFGFEAKERGATNHQLTQPFAVGVDDGFQSRPEMKNVHPWQGGLADSKIDIFIRGDYVAADSSADGLHNSVAVECGRLAGAYYGFIDTFRMKDTLGTLAFTWAYGLPVDPAINSMMEDWHDPSTKRRRVVPAVFWGNLWGAELIERLGLPVPEFVRKALGTMRSDWISPLFTDCGGGRVFWTFTAGGLADVMEHRDRVPELLDAKRRVTKALVERGVTLNKRPWVGPRLDDEPQEPDPRT
ncbi:MAG TPA: hypothetical protein VEB22_08460 [Phycisphaerales bacterium]|nr:hypothetical protein [Phycisphaerales bacterium]